MVHFYTRLYVQIYPPPRHGQFERHVGYSPPPPPPLCEIFFSTVCILVGVSPASPSITVLRVSAKMMKQVDIGPGVW